MSSRLIPLPVASADLSTTQSLHLIQLQKQAGFCFYYRTQPKLLLKLAELELA
jgi:hypothetical protein